MEVLPIKNDWEFCLRGNFQFLNRLESYGCDIHFFTEQGTYEGVSDDFRFNTWFCNNIDSVEDAYQIGIYLLNLFNAAQSIWNPEFENLKIIEIYNGHRQHISKNIPPIARLTNSDIAHVNKEELDKYVNETKGDEIFSLIHLSKDHDDVWNLLNGYILKPDWRGLSTICETVKAYAENNNISLTVDTAKEKLFFRTANDFSSIGMQARHGDKGWKPAPKPMPEIEAQEFVRKLVQEYLIKMMPDS